MLWTLLGILLTASTVQAQVVSDLDHFKLFNFCRPMLLEVADLTSDARGIGLTEEGVQLAVESRLRAARLYTESWEEANLAFLFIDVHVARRAFSITVQYHKLVTDLATNSNGPAITWDDGSTGTYRSGAGFIIQGLSSYLDKFLANYLRVNDPACNTR